jgi:hypothetical protein
MFVGLRCSICSIGERHSQRAALLSCSYPNVEVERKKRWHENDQKSKKKLTTLATTSQGKRKWLFYAKKVVLLCEETART